jgi:hypothetical protein
LPPERSIFPAQALAAAAVREFSKAAIAECSAKYGQASIAPVAVANEAHARRRRRALQSEDGAGRAALIGNWRGFGR